MELEWNDGSIWSGARMNRKNCFVQRFHLIGRFSPISSQFLPVPSHTIFGVFLRLFHKFFLSYFDKFLPLLYPNYYQILRPVHMALYKTTRMETLLIYRTKLNTLLLIHWESFIIQTHQLFFFNFIRKSCFIREYGMKNCTCNLYTSSVKIKYFIYKKF